MRADAAVADEEERTMSGYIEGMERAVATPYVPDEPRGNPTYMTADQQRSFRTRTRRHYPSTWWRATRHVARPAHPAAPMLQGEAARRRAAAVAKACTRSVVVTPAWWLAGPHGWHTIRDRSRRALTSGERVHERSGVARGASASKRVGQ